MARCIEIAFTANANVSYPGESYGTKPEEVTQGSISWELDGKRYHLWVARNDMWTPEAGNKKWLIQQSVAAPAVLYCNPPRDAQERGLPTFKTKHLQPDAAKNAPMVELAMAFANSGALEADAERRIAQGLLDIAAEKKSQAEGIRSKLKEFFAAEVAKADGALLFTAEFAAQALDEAKDDTLLGLYNILTRSR